jgi:hypothetical protein
MVADEPERAQNLNCEQVCSKRLTQPARPSSRNWRWYVIMDMKISPSGQTMVRPTAVPRSPELRLCC